VFSRIGAQTPDMEGEWRGLEAFSGVVAEYLRPFSDLRIEAEQIIDLDDDRVLVLSRQTARGKLSGAPIEHEFGDLFTLGAGKVVRYDSYWDRAVAMEAVGLSDQ
jgi:ketosteroid isomerase-like protein